MVLDINIAIKKIKDTRLRKTACNSITSGNYQPDAICFSVAEAANLIQNLGILPAEKLVLNNYCPKNEIQYKSKIRKNFCQRC